MFRLLFKLTNSAACLHSQDTKRSQKYLNTYQGRKFLDLRLIGYKCEEAFGSGS